MAVTAHGTRTGTDIGRDPNFAEAAAAKEVIARFVASLEAALYSGDDSVSLIRLFNEIERLGAAGKTLTAVRVARSNVHTRAGHRSAAEFIAAQTGDSLGESKELLGLGDALSDQPALDQALREGKLSKRRAKRVADAVRINPAKEAELVQAAQTDTDTGLNERLLRAKAEGRTGEAAERHRRRLHESRSARTWTDTDGAFHLDARFAPEAGAELKAALEAQTDRQFHRARREGRFENADAYRADALLALVTGTGLLGVGNTEPPRRAGAGDPAPDTPVRTREPKATVNVVVDLDTLRRGNVQPGERCEIPGVGPVSVTHARELLGDSLFNVVVTSATDIHSIWSPGRHLRRDVRAGLLLRDPRCVVPGCDARLGLECDHWVTDFAEGGLTGLDNLARLCKRHHRQRTHEGFELRQGPNGWEWIPPATRKAPKRPRRAKPRTKAPPRSALTPARGQGPSLLDPGG